jgi:hypothetical protein
VILSSDPTLALRSAWGEVFGDDAVAVATIDPLVRHAEILSLRATAAA